ncbi:AMP-binding protein, partial [Rhizobium johnstonii]|uniref:AMP-binding protein n=1 Tax=Rhizobium johnstonii TaxID=3019933 RepID=UPI003F9B0A66
RRRGASRGITAIRFRGVDTTYDELADRVERLAEVFASHGVARGESIAYLGDNHPSFLECLFAAGRLGAVFVPLNTRLAPKELAYMINDSRARILVASPAQSTAADAVAEAAAVERVLLVGGGAGHLDESIAAAAPGRPAEHVA